MKRHGFTVVEAILILVIIGILGLVGYVAYSQLTKQPASSEQSTVVPVSTQDVTSTSDLDTVNNELDSIDTSDKDDITTIGNSTTDL